MRVPHPRLQGCTQPIEHGAQLAAYLAAGKQAISRAEAEERMFAKLAGRLFLADVRPLLAAEEAIKLDAAAAHAAFGSRHDEVLLDLSLLDPGDGASPGDDVHRRDHLSSCGLR